jgi:hypothetical protein
MEKSEEKEVVNEEKKIINELENLQERVQNLQERVENLEKKNQLKDELFDELEKKELLKREENKKRYIKVFKIIFSIILASGIVFFIYKIQTKSTPYVSSAQVEDYSSFVESWNSQVNNITADKTFLLSFSKNNENIEKLNALLQNFYIAEITDSAKYNDFLEKNKFAKAMILNSRMKEQKLLNSLKEVTQETVISTIVKKILIMNSKRIWEEHKNDK